jgi:VWFA-related protein
MLRMSVLNHRRLVAFVIPVLLVVGLRSGPQAQSPSGGDPVSVSFVTLGRDGRPIVDLKAEEVQLRVDGRQRTLKSFERIDASTPSSGEGAKPSGPPLPAPFGTNVAGANSGGGRTTSLVIDDGSFRPGNDRLMKQSIDSFLNTIPPADRVALLTAPLSSVRTDPTTPAEVRQALAKVAAHGAPIPTDDAGLQRYQNDVACRTRETLEALRGLLSSLTGASIPPTMIFFSAGISATTRTTGNLGTSNCDLSTDAFQNVGAAAAAARAHVYVVQADLTPAQRSEGLENLAGVTGAQVMVLATTGENALNRIAIETSASYLATFDPEPSERNGQPHRLEVRVTRPDTTVRAGTQIAIARADGKNARKGAVSPRDMLREATVFRDLPLRVAAFPSREAPDKLKLVALGELVDPSVKLTGAVIGVYDTKGKLVAQSTAPSESLTTMPLMFAAVVPPGTYRVRLAATDASGRSGTADFEIMADLTSAGALKLSSLLLGSDTGGFKPLLQFKDEPSAMATFELYGKPPGQLPLKLELAATADGPALLQAPPAGSGTKDPDRFIISGVFPIASLAPVFSTGRMGSPEGPCRQGLPSGRRIGTQSAPCRCAPSWSPPR